MKLKWHTAKYGDPYSEFVLCTHTAVNTHPEQWAAIYAAAHGEQLGFGALLKGTLVVVLRVERARTIQPLDYESNSLTIRPRLPHESFSIKKKKKKTLCNQFKTCCHWTHQITLHIRDLGICHRPIEHFSPRTLILKQLWTLIMYLSFSFLIFFCLVSLVIDYAYQCYHWY